MNWKYAAKVVNSLCFLQPASMATCSVKATEAACCSETHISGCIFGDYRLLKNFYCSRMIMEQQWLLVQPVSIALITVAIGLLLMAVSRKSKNRTPPGPWGWPVLGCIPLLGIRPHQSLAKLAKRYGPLMFFKLGSVNVVVASSPKMAEEFLKTHDRIWASRYASAASKIMSYEGMDIGFAEYGPRWQYAKKVLMTELLTAKRLSDFQKIRKQEMISGINNAIDGCCGGTKIFRMDLVMQKTALNIVCKMLIIKNTDNFQEIIKDAIRLFGAFYLGDFIPWLDRLDAQGLKKQMSATAKRLDEFFQKALDDHKMQIEVAKNCSRQATDDSVQDIVYKLLTRPRDVDGQHLTEVEMKGIMQVASVAGTDTSSSIIEWGLSELLKNPRILEKAQAEMDSVVGRDRVVEEFDLPNLPYLNAIVKETFRLHPPGPLLIPHMSVEDCEIQGYRIPAKTRLFVNIYAIQRDPEVYDRPTEFCPERFLDCKKDVHGLDFDLLPFGTGRRICPGKGLGILLVQYALALYIQTCNWSLPGNLKLEDLDMEEKFGVNLPRLNPLRVIVVPRLSRHVLHDLQN